jgi:hypothetical protein
MTLSLRSGSAGMHRGDCRVPNKPVAIKKYEERITGEYIAGQVTQRRQAETHQAHKTRMEEMDRIYKGDLGKYREQNEATPKDYLLIENKFKNALHDVTRLAAEPREVPVFMQQGDGVKEYKAARVREGITDTIWEMGNGTRLKRKLYMDSVGGGYMAVAAHFNNKSEYAQFYRMDPRFCYPTVRNGVIQDMLYVETMPKAQAMVQWPDLPLNATIKDNKDVQVVTYIDDTAVSQAVTQSNAQKTQGFITDRWVHKLDCVPVAFVPLDTWDSTFRGLFDQIGGPMALRNRTMSYLNDYMEDMVHAPFEQKNILNGEDPPGPLTVYQHDPHAEESFIRRVAPAAPAGAVFGTLQYMDQQESVEALQPPARVGQVKQSIASGDFVNSTQGALSSAVRELQDNMADLRKQLTYICFKIEEKWLDNEKPLLRAVGDKTTYTPSKDIKGVYAHRVLFGAAAGLDRQYADVRVLQHVGSGLISKKTARGQLDYLDDPTSEQNYIDQEQLATVLFQRFSADPNTPLSEVATALVAMGEGKDLVEVMKEQAARMAQREKEAQEAAMAAQAGGGETLPQGEAPRDAEEEALALDKGETGGGAAIAPISPFAPPPLQQQIVASRRQ